MPFPLRNRLAPGFLCAVSKLKAFAIYWLPVLLWMAVIFSASNDRVSSQRSSRLIEPIVRWLFPRAPTATVHQVVYYVRKGAHVTEYAVFALLLWRTLSYTWHGSSRSWSWKIAGCVLLLAVVYAASDEWHQRFVPNREGRPMDVLIDTSGAVLGLAVMWAWTRRRQLSTPATAPARSAQDSL